MFHSWKITINEPVDYMARAVPNDFDAGQKSRDFQGPPLSIAQVMSFAPQQNHKGQAPYNQQVHWSFYANENRVVVSGPKHLKRAVKYIYFTPR